MTTTITICETCRFSTEEKTSGDKTGGEVLISLVSDCIEDQTSLTLRTHACLMGCERHCNVALSAPGKLTYVIGKFVPEMESAQAIVDFAALYDVSETGQVPYREWPAGVKGHFIARVPPLDVQS